MSFTIDVRLFLFTSLFKCKKQASTTYIQNVTCRFMGTFYSTRKFQKSLIVYKNTLRIYENISILSLDIP